MTKKEEIITMLNKALELEHAANVQYLSHAELITGLDCEPIVARLKEIAGDEQKHAEMFRTCLCMLDAEPSMGIAPTHRAGETRAILKANLKDERDAVDYYRTIQEKLKEARAELKYEYDYIEHAVRHIITEEEEHAYELRTLLGE